MKSILIDVGPLIALFDKSDQYHDRAIDFIKGFKGFLWTTWPVITEVTHMLDFNTKAQIGFLEWVRRGGLQLVDLDLMDLERIIVFCQKFNDVPLDLADASLMVVAEEKNLKEIASVDSDFYIYRDKKNRYLKNIF